MNLLEASKVVQKKHVLKASELVQKHGINWLLKTTGRSKPKSRYVVVEGFRYPTKAFGFLVAQLAGETNSTQNDMTTNEARAPLKRLGFDEVPTAKRLTDSQRDARSKSYYQILARPQQSEFRRKLLDAYNQTCPITGCSVVEALEAAHIQPVSENGSDELGNGLLLRGDLHRLFDAHLVAIEPENLTIAISKNLVADYGGLIGKKIKLHSKNQFSEALTKRWKVFQKLQLEPGRGMLS